MSGCRQEMIDALEGRRTGRIPYCPRFDLWFNAHSEAGTLPENLKHCRNAKDVSLALEVGYNSVVPDFAHPRTPEETQDRSLGLYNVFGMPCKYVLRKTERKIEQRGAEMRTVYVTPVGKVSTSCVYTDEMRRAGASISMVREHAIKSREDYKVLRFIFENIELRRDLRDAMKYDEWVGDAGMPVHFGCLAVSPMQFIMRDIIDVTQFYYHMHDYPEELDSLARSMGGFFDKLFETIAAGPGKVFLAGGNFDETITYKPFFEKYIEPYLQRLSAMLHYKGKYLLCHCDGENNDLLDMYGASGIDIMEAVALHPMTKNTYREIRERVGESITIWGGINSTALLPTVSDEEFEAYISGLLDDVRRDKHFIIGVSDTTPANAVFDRILKVKEMVASG